jgi:hypothetical protein
MMGLVNIGIADGYMEVIMDSRFHVNDRSGTLLSDMRCGVKRHIKIIRIDENFHCLDRW